MGKRLSLVVVAILSLLLANSSPCQALTQVPNGQTYEQWGDYDYIIEQYDITIDVGADNKYHITEKLNVHFNTLTDKHGIYRDIPTNVDIRRADGSSSKLRVHVSDIRVEGWSI